MSTYSSQETTQHSNQATDSGACLLTAVQDSLRRAGCSSGTTAGKASAFQARNPLIGHLLEQRLEFVPSPGNWDAKVLEKLKLLGATILTTARALPGHQLLGSQEQLTTVSDIQKPQPIQLDPAKKPPAQPVGPSSASQFSFAAVQLDRAYPGQPCGFVNEGNYCYMISVLQALIHTAPFANFACEHRAASACHRQAQELPSRHQQPLRHQQKSRWCAVCELAAYVQRPPGAGSAYPRAFMARVTAVSPTLRSNRQEDAHEFLRCLLDYMEANCGAAQRSQRSPANAIRILFGGRLKSSVVCTRCGTKSRTFEDFMDLSLCIQWSSSLADCLRKFVSPDLLKDSNAYKCEKCRTKVTAKKSFSIASGPPVLTIQLNRFQWGHSNKISRFVQFPLSMDIRPYMSKPGRPVQYELYALVIHQGSSTKFGHYYCYAKRGNAWWSLNDSSVDKITESRVLQSCPYILLYKRTDLSPLISVSASALSAGTVNQSEPAPGNGPKTPAHPKLKIMQNDAQTSPKLESAGTVSMETSNGPQDLVHTKIKTKPAQGNTAAMVTNGPQNPVNSKPKPITASTVAMATTNGPQNPTHSKPKLIQANTVAMATTNGPQNPTHSKTKPLQASPVAVVTTNGPQNPVHTKPKSVPASTVAMATGNGPLSKAHAKPQPAAPPRSKPNKELRQLMSADPMRPEPLPWSASPHKPQTKTIDQQPVQNLPQPVLTNGGSNERKRKANDSISSADEPPAQPSDADRKRRKKETKLALKRKLKLLKLCVAQHRKAIGSTADSSPMANGINPAICNGHAD